MAAAKAIGAIELSSVGVGYKIEDEMLKAAAVDLLIARTICSGKYLIAIGGDVASVQAAVEAGAKRAAGSLIEKRTIVHVHESVFPAISMAVDLLPENIKALGFIETFSASSIIDVADAAAKTAEIVLFRIHLAMAIGGKGFVLMTGDVASVEAAVAAGCAIAAEEGILVGSGVIAAPSKELFREYV